MKRTILRAAFAAGAAIAAASVCSADPTSAPAGTLLSAIKTANALYLKQDYKGALAALNEVTSSPDFGSIAESSRSEVFTMQSLAAIETGDDALASRAARAATEWSAASYTSWEVRFLADAGTNDAGDGLPSLTILANRWPSEIGQLPDETILWALRYAASTDALHRPGIVADEALYDAHWRPRYKSFDWNLYDLAIDLLERRQNAKAAEVTHGIRAADLIFKMSIDHRFDGIAVADPVVAMLAYAKQTREDANLQPRSLAKLNAHIHSLLRVGDGSEALKAADIAVSQSKKPSSFDDQQEQLVWTLNYRAWALDLLGRYDDAVSQMQDAARMQENGRPNISQTINLAEELYRSGRPAEAIAAVAPIDQANTSHYGFNAANEVKACAAAELHDVPTLTKALEELNRDSIDNPDSRFNALICAGDLDGAAATLIAQLANPETRTAMLVAMQEFEDPVRPLAWWTSRKSELSALRQRADVRAAIDAAGRVRTWPFRWSP